MSFFRQIRSCLKYLANSFKPDYCPPGCASNGNNLESIINDCSVQGKILILHLTNNQVKSNIDLTQFDEENYIVYEAPYNSRECYEITRNLSLTCLPSVSLYFCRTKYWRDMMMIREIKSINDIKIARRLIFMLRDELGKRKRSFNNSKISRVILDDQDKEYNEILEQVQKEEREKLQKEEEEKREKEKIENKKQEAFNRFNSLPPEPTNEGCIEVMFKICNKPTKSRKFLKTDQIQLMFDFVDIDITPSNTLIKYGYPIKTINEEDKVKTFEEMKFGKRVVVQVDQDDDYEC